MNSKDCPFRLGPSWLLLLIPGARPGVQVQARRKSPLDPHLHWFMAVVNKAATSGCGNGLVVREAGQPARAAAAQPTESSKATADAPSAIRPVLVAPITPASPSSTAPIARSDRAKMARVPRIP